MYVLIEIYEDGEPASVSGMVQFVGAELDRTNEAIGSNVNMRWAVIASDADLEGLLD